MVKRQDDLAISWLGKAATDLLTAEKLAGGGDPILETAIFHCQQAAEKALKGFLVSCGAKLQKTHDITVLLELASKSDIEFQKWLSAGDLLTFCGTGYRYPGEVEQPSTVEFDSALSSAKAIFNFVEKKLSI